MEGTIFQKIESMLYRYYQEKDQIDRLKKSLETVEQQIKDIRIVLSDKEDLYPSIGIVGKYTMATSGNGDSQLADPVFETYKQHLKIVKKLEKELSELLQARISLKLRIFKIEQYLDGIEFSMERLSEFEQKLAEEKYKYKKSNLQIGMILGYDEKSIRNWRRKLAAKIAKSLNVS